MPADLKNPFGPSCCDGGACSEEHASAQPCGCDEGINWTCANHKFKEQARSLASSLREKAEEYKNDDLAFTIYTDCADRLEELL